MSFAAQTIVRKAIRAWINIGTQKPITAIIGERQTSTATKLCCRAPVSGFRHGRVG